MKTVKDIISELKEEKGCDFETLEEVTTKIEAKIRDLPIINQLLIRGNTYIGGLCIRYGIRCRRLKGPSLRSKA